VNSFSLNIDLLPISVAIYKKDDDDFIFTAFNKQAEITENISAEKLIGKKLTEVFPGVKEFGLFDVLARVEESGESELFNTELYKDERISGWRHNEVVKLSDGLVAAFYSDKSIEKELEEESIKLQNELTKIKNAIEEQKSVFQKIMEGSESISVQGYNDKHEVIYWNNASETLYGYTRSEALGKKLEDLIIPLEMRDRVKSVIDNWIDNDVAVPSAELALLDKSGNSVNVFSQHVAIKNSENRFEMYCLDIDLREIKKLENELAQERNFLNTILNIIPDLIWLKDTQGSYLKCNHKFEQFFGAKEQQIINKTDFDFVDKELAQFFRNNDLLAINADKPTLNEEYLTFADGSHKGDFETIKTPMKNEDGKITGVLGIARDISERKNREKELEKFANFDTLTGLTNRTVFMDRLTQLINSRESKDIFHAILFIDLDRFKEINDTMGHTIGDEILIMVATRLKEVIRKGDTLARLGGDEFTILLENIKLPIKASIVAQKVLEILREPFFINEHNFYITSSIGISIFPDDSSSAEKLLQFADSAMYKAKERGKDTFEFYTKELSILALEKVSTINALRHAISNNEFELYYQAQTDANSKKTVAAEALIRWNHPSKGLISPFTFIPIAESSGQILEIGKWVILQGMKDITEFKSKYLDIEKISINLSTKQLHDESLIDSIEKSLKQTGCRAEWIEFEVTESYTMHDPESAILLLHKIKALGFSLSIDDFGTGYSSLSYLKKLPINKLKIDKSFVDDITKDSDDAAIVHAVILIAESMRLDVIAEGVETQEQQEFLIEHGCYLSQGYLYSKPIPKREFEEFLLSSSS